LFAAVVIAALLGSNLYTYHRLTNEALVARLKFTPIGVQHYQVELRSGDSCQPQVVDLYGDQWRIDARFLKWKAWANLLGMDALYRLERLGGRYQSESDENSRKHRVHTLSDTPLIDLARYIDGRQGAWLPVDTRFGSSVYETIDPDYEYAVYRSQSGLLVRKQRIPAAHYEQGKLVIDIVRGCS